MVEARVVLGAPGLSGEPITIARLRADDGTVRDVRIVGGPSPRGGTTRLAGHVIPTRGLRVRVDLREERAPSDRVASWTFGETGATWPPSALPIRFALPLAVSRDLAGAEEAELDVALRAWPLVPCTALRTAFAGRAAIAPADDGVNGVFFHDDAWPKELLEGALAQTILHTDASGRLHDADIHINGAGYRWAIEGDATRIDLRGVLVHELGHALGLGHSASPRATMVPTPPSPLAWRSLEADDRAGICALYPGQGDPGCESGAACPAGYACVARRCERAGATKTVCSPCERVPGACEAAGDDARCVDFGVGAAAGRVCGRACAKDDDCGPRFACVATTTSGDWQCVAREGCAAGPTPCTKDEQCAAPYVCRGGACAGRAEAEADAGGGDADADAQPAAAAMREPGGGCSTGGGATDVGWLLPLAPALWRRRRRRVNGSGR